MGHLLLGVAVLAVASPSQAQTPPARRPGLWEMRQGPAGVPNLPAIRICIGAADASGDFRPARSGSGGSKCDYQRISASASEVRWRNVCSYDGDTNTMEGRAYDVKPDSFKQDIQMSGSMGKGTVHVEARWLGADCAAASRP
jgi:hypothetical protein